MNCEHSFNIELAKIVGIEKAILLKNIHWWILKNSKNNRNFKNGKYWTFNSARAFSELFPYMNPRSIRRWLLELENDGWLETSNFNKRKNDKTIWYGLGEKLIEVCKKRDWEVIDHKKSLSQFGKPIRQNDKTDCQTDKSICQNGKTLPDVSTDINKDVVAVVLNDGHKNFFEDLKKVDIENNENVKFVLKKLFEYCEISSAEVSILRIIGELEDLRKVLSKNEIWSIIIESFEEISGKEDGSRNVNYLLAKIRGKKNELFNSKQKIHFNKSCQREMFVEEKLKVIEMAKERFDRCRLNLNPETITEVEKLLKQEKYLSVMKILEGCG